MSMNLMLSFKDSKGREVGYVNLIQTSTTDTYWILGLSKKRGQYPNWNLKPQKDDDQTIKNRYFSWLDEQKASYDWDEEAVQFAKGEVESAYTKWTPDYKPNWSYV